MAKTKAANTEATGGAADQSSAPDGLAQSTAGGADAPLPQAGGSWTRLEDGTLVPRGNDNNAPLGKE